MVDLGSGSAREVLDEQHQAIHAHEQVGREVREAIKRIGGDLPEHIAPVEHIKKVVERVKASTPKLELEQRDAQGLFGEDKLK
jgi:DNA-damage-inducible protein D